MLALRRGPFGRVLVATKDSEAACATLGLSLTTTKLVVFTLSAAMAGLGRRLPRRGPPRWPAGTDFEMFESLLILAVVAIGGASVCSGALAGGLALGFLPGNAEDIFIGAGTVVLAFYSDGVLPAGLRRFHRVVGGPRQRPAAQPVPVARAEDGPGGSPGPGRPEPGGDPPSGGGAPGHAIVRGPGSR